MPGGLALITGVGRAGQVGETVARTFAERGARVILVSRSPDEIAARVADLRAAGLDATGYACDLAEPAGVDALARRVEVEHGGALNALVNLAGGFATSGPVAESDPGVWERLTRINLLTAYAATRAFLPQLRKARGAIVYFGAAAALPGGSVSGLWAYSAAKGAVLTLMRAVAGEERDAGVRANAVAPTAIRTATNLEAMGDQVRYVERQAVADAVWYLCSEGAQGVNGQVVRLG
ncbi:MAG: SDR family oxidoreductase [Gemmatimonadota bacterium]|nr:SDR family oxidoreductase [Gemmatimonadota bacterium]MDE3129046.1 SDR family oxidoreductase [Gemmatimonadota bacterium]MDE3172456.1 SDR family oxidoreductase [Gemmatimonadota bacterium]MDE3214878.1 SDR family oxidoreductase [Gemmatimonadota bacterium]